MDIQTMVYKICERARDQRRSLLYPNDEHCAYRSHDGLACFVGVLIPDDRYSASMEGFSVSNLLEETDAIPVQAEQYAAVFKLLSEAQRIHDLFPPATWELMLTEAVAEINRAFDLGILVLE